VGVAAIFTAPDVLEPAMKVSFKEIGMPSSWVLSGLTGTAVASISFLSNCSSDGDSTGANDGAE